MKRIDLLPVAPIPNFPSTTAFETPISEFSSSPDSTTYELQAFAEKGRAVLIFSDTPENFGNSWFLPLDRKEALDAAVGETLEKLGITDIKTVEIIHHTPEYVAGHLQEQFCLVTYEDFTRYSDLESKRPMSLGNSTRVIIEAEEVAEKIGPENFVEKQFAQPEPPETWEQRWERTAPDRVATEREDAEWDHALAEVESEKTATPNDRGNNIEPRNELEPEF